MSRWVLDTDVLSAMFKGQLSQNFATSVFNRPLGVTFVQIGELSRWVNSRNWGISRRQELGEWVGQFPIVHSSASIAERWGVIAANASKRGRPVPINDSWIAACCLTHGLPLVTLNKRDFADFAEFEGLELIS